MDQPYKRRLERCGQLMKAAGLDVLLLTKPSNMFYLTGDGRLCAYAMITQGGRVALGVPQTDIEEVKQLAHFEQLVGFEDEVGMIHSIAHYFKHFGIDQGQVGLEFTFLTQSMMGMLTHPPMPSPRISSSRLPRLSFRNFDWLKRPGRLNGCVRLPR